MINKSNLSHQSLTHFEKQPGDGSCTWKSSAVPLSGTLNTTSLLRLPEQRRPAVAVQIVARSEEGSRHQV